MMKNHLVIKNHQVIIKKNQRRNLWHQLMEKSHYLKNLTRQKGNQWNTFDYSIRTTSNKRNIFEQILNLSIFLSGSTGAIRDILMSGKCIPRERKKINHFQLSHQERIQFRIRIKYVRYRKYIKCFHHMFLNLLLDLNH